MMSYKSLKNRINKINPEDFDNVELVSSVPDTPLPGHDFKIISYYSSKKSYVVFVSRSSIVDLCSERMHSIADQIFAIARPEYGFGFRRLHRLGPALYPIGLSQGLSQTGLEDAESLNISFWNHAMDLQSWRRGLLRDVYPLNFLTGPQLAATIDGQPLEQWIGADSRRGALAAGPGNMMLWTVPEAAIPGVRSALWYAHCLFDWTRDIEGIEGHPAIAKAREWWESR